MKKYIVEVQKTIIETFEVLAENKEQAEENYSDGNEIDWDQIESEVLNVEKINE